MTRPWGVAAAIVLLVASPLLCTTTDVKNKEEKNHYIVLKSLSQPKNVESLRVTSNHYPLKKVHKNFATLLYQSNNFPKKDSSTDKASLSELNILQHNNGIIKLKANRRNTVFFKKSSTPVSAGTGLPPSQILSPAKTTLREVNAVDLLTERFTSKALTDSNTVYRKNGLNIQRRVKKSVITLGDGETVNCVNKSTVNNSCKNDGNLIFVLGNENINRSVNSGQLNNSFSNRNLKASKDFSSLSLSRLTLTVPRKKFVDFTESGMGYRSPSPSEPSHKYHPSLRFGNDTSIIQNTSVNISYMAPSVKPPGRLSAATSAPDNLDAASITGITLGSVVFLGIVGAMCFVLYKRRNQNKPQTLSDKSSNPDSSVYIEESSDDSEEMYSLDNDSFLNSLEAMTIQNYWTENVKHTKL